MSVIELKDLNKQYPNGVQAIKKINMKIESGEFVVLLGPSGCGKTTLLRLIAGLENTTAGNIFINGKDIKKSPPDQRGVAMVFQNYALYPNMTVRKNMSFCLEIQKKDKREIEERIQSVSKILHLEELLNRKPKTLSGGQRQRVALGRAMIKNPNIFLFDEPLSNLDASIKNELMIEIVRLWKELKMTIIYVTHDQVEALSIGSKIIVMKNGEIFQEGSPTEILNCPSCDFVRDFVQLNIGKNRTLLNDIWITGII